MAVWLSFDNVMGADILSHRIESKPIFEEGALQQFQNVYIYIFFLYGNVNCVVKILTFFSITTYMRLNVGSSNCVLGQNSFV